MVRFLELGCGEPARGSGEFHGAAEWAAAGTGKLGADLFGKPEQDGAAQRVHLEGGDRHTGRADELGDDVREREDAEQRGHIGEAFMEGGLVGDEAWR